MHDAGQGVERLVRADVRGRLLAADVLLAGLQREHEAAAAVDVARLADDAARHAADQRLAWRRRSRTSGPAEGRVVAERLPLPHADVGAVAARRLEQPERRRVGRDDRQRARRVRGLDQRGRVLERSRGSSAAARAGRRRRRRAPRAARRGRCSPPSCGHLLDRVAEPLRERRDRRSRVCGCTARATSTRVRPVWRHGHRDRLGRRRRAVVHRRVGDRQARSAPRSRSGTRRSPSACPARPRAGTACRRSGTRSGP